MRITDSMPQHTSFGYHSCHFGVFFVPRATIRFHILSFLLIWKSVLFYSTQSVMMCYVYVYSPLLTLLLHPSNLAFWVFYHPGSWPKHQLFEYTKCVFLCIYIYIICYIYICIFVCTHITYNIYIYIIYILIIYISFSTCLPNWPQSSWAQGLWHFDEWLAAPMGWSTFAGWVVSNIFLWMLTPILGRFPF